MAGINLGRTTILAAGCFAALLIGATPVLAGFEFKSSAPAAPAPSFVSPASVPGLLPPPPPAPAVAPSVATYPAGAPSATTAKGPIVWEQMPAQKVEGIEAIPLTPSERNSLPPASSPDIVSGFGKDLPLMMALQQVVPQQYKISLAPGVKSAAHVSWRGDRPWKIVLSDMLEPAHLSYALQGNTLVVQHADHDGTALPVSRVSSRKADMIPDDMVADNAPVPLGAASGHVVVSPAAPVHAGANSRPQIQWETNEGETAARTPLMPPAALTPPPAPAPVKTATAPAQIALPSHVLPPLQEANVTSLPPPAPVLPPPAPVAAAVSPAAQPLSPQRLADIESLDDEPVLPPPPAHPQYVRPQPVAPSQPVQFLTPAPKPTPIARHSAPLIPPPPLEPPMPAPVPVSEPVATPVRIAAAPAPVAEPPTVIEARWRAQKGQTLKEVLKDWSQAAHVKLYWVTDYDYKLNGDIAYGGNFEDAVGKLFDQFNAVKPQPYGQLHRNADSGNVLVVNTYGTYE